MINHQEFRKHAHQLVDYIADYLGEIENFPVKSQVPPGSVFRKIPDQPPDSSESIDAIMDDFNNIILPGITHWQHPNFHAYFTGNSSYPSVLAEMLTAAVGAQCMLWETSPAATELEEKMMGWLKSMLGLPAAWSGVIQDTASTATLVAVISAREWKTQWKINQTGFDGNERFTVYCSEQAHSSVDKAIRISGIGKDALKKIEVDREFALKPGALQAKIQQDVAAGFTPLLTIATLGTTGTTAVDPLHEIAEICQQYQMWLHVDAAWAGSALILPQLRWMINGLEMADSFVFNPHKWMFTNFDCSAYFVKDPDILTRTFAMVPEYLKTKTSGVNNYSDWGVQLGRRFRALKLWFVIRNFGIEGLKSKIEAHILWAKQLAEKIDLHADFQLLQPAPLSCVCFRYMPANKNQQQLNRINQELLRTINESGKIYLSHTKLNGKLVIRLVVGQTYQTESSIDYAWQVIQDISQSLTTS